MTLDELMDLAAAVAPQSPNLVRKVGAAVDLVDGGQPIAACNTFPAGVRNLPERCAGEGRFIWMEHAERNAIFAAARTGRALAGARLATTFFPCFDCARAIVQSGIAEVVTPPPAFDDPVWGLAFPKSLTILQEGGVRIVHAHVPA